MTEKFKILAKYIKDMSSETSDIETFLFVKEIISLGGDIKKFTTKSTIKALKEKYV